MMLLAVLLSSVSLTLAAFSQVVFEPEAATNSLLQLQLQLGKDPPSTAALQHCMHSLQSVPIRIDCLKLI